MRLVYIAHDVGDPKVQQRCRELVRLGHEVTVFAYDRGKTLAEAARLPCPTVSLGRTADYAYLQRVWSIVSGTIMVLHHRRKLTAVDAIIARNLEPAVVMLLATTVGQITTKKAYESLDIHRFLLSEGKGGRLLRWIERRLLTGIDLLVVSSPWFIRSFYEPVQRYAGAWYLLENKVAGADLEAAIGTRRPGQAVAARDPAMPWRIGWFGMLRCMRSLQILGELAAKFEGRLRVSIRGRPTEVSVEEFSRMVERFPGLTYGGPYRNPADLRQVYDEIDLVWGLDFYDEGKNSQWLLPNRLYEALCLGKPLLALAGTATGDYVAARGVGWAVGAPVSESLPHLLGTMNEGSYAAVTRSIEALPVESYVDHGELDGLLTQLLASGGGAPPVRSPDAEIALLASGIAHHQGDPADIQARPSANRDAN